MSRAGTVWARDTLRRRKAVSDGICLLDINGPARPFVLRKNRHWIIYYPHY